MFDSKHMGKEETSVSMLIVKSKKRAYHVVDVSFGGYPVPYNQCMSSTSCSGACKSSITGFLLVLSHTSCKSMTIECRRSERNNWTPTFFGWQSHSTWLDPHATSIKGDYLGSTTSASKPNQISSSIRREHWCPSLTCTSVYVPSMGREVSR